MYLVIEMQMWPDGSYHYIPTSYSDRMEAESKYHTILSASALAKHPRQGACILDENLNLVMGYVYQHGEYLQTEGSDETD